MCYRLWHPAICCQGQVQTHGGNSQCASISCVACCMVKEPEYESLNTCIERTGCPASAKATHNGIVSRSQLHPLSGCVWHVPYGATPPFQPCPFITLACPAWHCCLVMQVDQGRGAMQAQHGASAWEQLPLGVQQRILLLAGSSCARRVSKALRDAFDDANDT